MRQRTRRSFAAAASLAALLVVAIALPALAKEGLLATFDAPIAMGTPGGTEILVGMMVTVPDGDVTHPVEGSPIYLKLVGRDGSLTRASGIPDRTPGHYTMRIAIPEGGARRAEVGIHGTTDLPIMLMADPFAFGGITARTAQVAPALAPPMTPFPRASAPAAVDGTAEAGTEPATAAAPAAPASGSSPLSYLLAGIVALVLVVIAAVALAIRRRSRQIASRTAPERAPGA